MNAQFVWFILLSLPLIFISRKSLLNPGTHGFYRFLAFEGILWLLVANLPFWFSDPFTPRQIASWILLFISLYLVTDAVIRLRRHGKARQMRDDPALMSFEKTTQLVESGIYRYIRHPMYSSLLFLCWGIFLKHPGAGLFGVALVVSGLLTETALIDEKECRAYFGETYRHYMQLTKRFVPFIL